MDILPTNILNLMVSMIKVFFVLAGLIIVGLNYFHTKEARKMEKKLDVPLPISVNLGMSFQFILSIIFLFLTTIFLFIF